MYVLFIFIYIDVQDIHKWVHTWRLFYLYKLIFIIFFATNSFWLMYLFVIFMCIIWFKKLSKQAKVSTYFFNMLWMLMLWCWCCIYITAQWNWHWKFSYVLTNYVYNIIFVFAGKGIRWEWCGCLLPCF